VSGPWGTRCSRVVMRVWIGTYMAMFSLYASLLLHRKPELIPCNFSYPLEIGHLKLHIIGDVNLSHSLGIVL
jgi:hypothetical protein